MADELSVYASHRTAAAEVTPGMLGKNNIQLRSRLKMMADLKVALYRRFGSVFSARDTIAIA